MGRYPYPMLERPMIFSNANTNRKSFVSEWVQTLPCSGAIDWGKIDAIFLGIPVPRVHSMFASSYNFIRNYRNAWRDVTTYHLEKNVDLEDIYFADIGNIRQPKENHVSKVIEEVMYEMRSHHSHILQVCLGVDRGVDRSLLEGIKKSAPDKKIGVLQYSNNLNKELINSLACSDNGENTIESLHVIGIHGFTTCKSLMIEAVQAGMTYTRLPEMRKKGVARTIKEVIEVMSNQVDMIYVTVNMNVVDRVSQSFDSIMCRELMESAYLSGLASKTGCFTLVYEDEALEREEAVAPGVNVMLSLLSGYCERKSKNTY
ncbi:arginase family protein [Guptibacillus algicola]|uniref:arginase family protein n=1 Tax=Guptibacillus algicola TaxID=225844 RepID=UPI001CD67425|nr:arginase family protein [Alkalihalobacillus algicola]MCA0986882.1 arginase family protein [Alkalihalobacillus algicola]